MQKIGFGGCCHWCTEAVFQALRGVEQVEQGWIRSAPPYDSFSEAVIVSFDPDTISLSVLIEVHLRTHASQVAHSFRSKYRSAIYTFDPAQADQARTVMAALQSGFDKPLVTSVLPFETFKLSDERFQNYYLDNPERPFCKTYIDPKLAVIRKRFARHAKSESAERGPETVR